MRSSGKLLVVAAETSSPSAPTPLSPIGALARGVVAGAVGTAAMDTLWFVRYRRGGGTESPERWEFSAGLTSWDDAPAPALVGKRLVEGLFGIQIPASRVALVNNITHWGYGALGGAQYGVVAGSLARQRVSYGLPFGASVWGASYVVLPLAKLYKPIWDYDRVTLAKDLSAHLVYGLTTAAAMRLLSGFGRR
jgi:hypothetical protein